MDTNELIKAAPAIAKVAGPLAAAFPFTTIVKRMLGPAADELAEMWKDQIRLYRYERQLKCVEKAERMAQEAGFTPQAVPPKILFPLLEGASFEENEELHDMWAALLANAASPDNAHKVRPGFIAALKQLSPDEAMVLKWLLDKGEITVRDGLATKDLLQIKDDLRLVTNEDTLADKVKIDRRVSTCLEGLESAQLIHRRYWTNNALDLRVRFTTRITQRGLDFATACRPPKPQQ